MSSNNKEFTEYNAIELIVLLYKSFIINSKLIFIITMLCLSLTIIYIYQDDYDYHVTAKLSDNNNNLIYYLSNPTLNILKSYELLNYYDSFSKNIVNQKNIAGLNKTKQYLEYTDNEKEIVNFIINNKLLSYEKSDIIFKINNNLVYENINFNKLMKDIVHYYETISLNQIIKKLEDNLENLRENVDENIFLYQEQINYEHNQLYADIEVAYTKAEYVKRKTLLDLENNLKIALLLDYIEPIFEKLGETSIANITLGGDITNYNLELPRYLLGSKILSHEINRIKKIDKYDLIEDDLITKFSIVKNKETLLDKKLTPNLISLNLRIKRNQLALIELNKISAKNDLNMIHISEIILLNDKVNIIKALLLTIFFSIMITILTVFLRYISALSKIK